MTVGKNCQQSGIEKTVYGCECFFTPCPHDFIFRPHSPTTLTSQQQTIVEICEIVSFYLSLIFFFMSSTSSRVLISLSSCSSTLEME